MFSLSFFAFSDGWASLSRRNSICDETLSEPSLESNEYEDFSNPASPRKTPNHFVTAAGQHGGWMISVFFLPLIIFFLSMLFYVFLNNRL